MKTNAVVLVWHGNPLPDYIVGKLAETLCLNGVCIPENLTMKYFDQDSLPDALINSTVNIVKTAKVEDNIEEALKSAIIYIGTEFESILRKGDLEDFKMHLAARYILDKDLSPYNTEKVLTKAVEIIATTRAIIPGGFAARYHFSKKVIQVIKNVYSKYHVSQ